MIIDLTLSATTPAVFHTFLRAVETAKGFKRSPFITEFSDTRAALRKGDLIPAAPVKLTDNFNTVGVGVIDGPYRYELKPAIYDTRSLAITTPAVLTDEVYYNIRLHELAFMLFARVAAQSKIAGLVLLTADVADISLNAATARRQRRYTATVSAASRAVQRNWA